MNKINWKVRIANKQFWVSMIPMLALIIMQIADIFGYKLDITGLSDQLVALAGMIFSLLGLMGIVNDPTTEGLSDSERAMGYTKPE